MSPSKIGLYPKHAAFVLRSLPSNVIKVGRDIFADRSIIGLCLLYMPCYLVLWRVAKISVISSFNTLDASNMAREQINREIETTCEERELRCKRRS